LIAGVDEVGYGSCAGPIYSACVALDLAKAPHVRVQTSKRSKPVPITDSKKLTYQQRTMLFEKILDVSPYHYGLGAVTVHEINMIDDMFKVGNLVRKRAVSDFIVRNDYIKPSYLLIDAFEMETDIPHTSIIRGDSQSISIAAASIVAKVLRDEFMINLHKEFPNYGWDSNVGYHSKVHMEGLRKFGLTPFHRIHYKNVKENTK